MPKISTSKSSILVIDDSDDIRDLIGHIFRVEGFSVELARDGHEGLLKLQAYTELPGLILLDLMMPGMNGYEFRAEQSKIAKFANIPVIIMTADSNA